MFFILFSCQKTSNLLSHFLKIKLNFVNISGLINCNKKKFLQDVKIEHLIVYILTDPYI